MSRPVVVTGASGFIGRALVAELVHRGMHVMAVSRQSAPPPCGAEPVLVANYIDTPAPPGAVLVHLAERADIGEAEARGADHLREVRERMTALLAGAYARVVYASSGRVYGNRDRRPHRPTDETRADCIYTQSKLEVERLVRQSGRGAIARIGNVYGPSVKAGTVLDDILTQIPGSGPLHIRNAGPARDFIWLNDVARGLADIASGEATGAYNLGTGVASTAGDVAHAALRLCGQEARPVHSVVPIDAAAIDAIALDTAETTAGFGWRPEITLETGLRRLIEERQ